MFGVAIIRSVQTTFRTLSLMDVRYLIMCRYAELQSDGTMNLVGGDILSLTVEAFPGTYPAIVACSRVEFEESDFDVEHTFRIFIADDSGETINVGVEGTISPNDATEPSFLYAGAGIIANFGTTIFPKKNYYFITLEMDGIVLKKTRFQVVAKPSPASKNPAETPDLLSSRGAP